ncbi:RNA-directed DNA polymerase, eukaryota, partial [Tanacetum coccineum]
MEEFRFQRGLRQEDHLAPFLFILVMESLHISFTRIMERGYFSPISIGNVNKVSFSHLFYADDAIFIESMASMIGCKPATLPMSYLGIKVGDNMTRINAWKEVLSKVSNKLSRWKVKTLSVRGRLTLLKAVLGAIPTYYMSLYRAPLAVVTSLEAIRSKFFIGAENDEKNDMDRLEASFSSCEADALWVQVVKAIHGEQGDGHNTQFWNDAWIEDQPLKSKFPRLFALEMEKDVSVANKIEQDKLSTRLNISDRGLDIPSVICPICGDRLESSDHLFFSCSFVAQVYVLLAHWWDIPIPPLFLLALVGVVLRYPTKDDAKGVKFTTTMNTNYLKFGNIADEEMSDEEQKKDNR